jgi:cytoskeletal protein CcmA (bactofilin family)
MGIFGKQETTPPARATSPAAPPAGAKAKAAAGPAAVSSGSACVVGAKTVLKGDITGEEDVLVEGTVEGSIRIGRDLKVGPGGCVKASVSAQSIVVAGEVIGDCQATQRVHIEATGRLTGNIRAPRVIIVEGATFKGNSDMSPGGGRPGSA